MLPAITKLELRWGSLGIYSLSEYDRTSELSCTANWHNWKHRKVAEEFPCSGFRFKQSGVHFRNLTMCWTNPISVPWKTLARSIIYWSSSFLVSRSRYIWCVENFKTSLAMAVKERKRTDAVKYASSIHKRCNDQHCQWQEECNDSEPMKPARMNPFGTRAPHLVIIQNSSQVSVWPIILRFSECSIFDSLMKNKRKIFFFREKNPEVTKKVEFSPFKKTFSIFGGVVF